MQKSPTTGTTDGSASPKEPSRSSVTASGAKSEFPYRYIGSEEQAPLAPLVPVEIARAGQEPYVNELLIDSGADATVFPMKYMEEFGISIEECEKRRLHPACGEDAQGYQYMEGVPARIQGADVRLKIVFVETTEEPVLGRADFFDSFRVTLDQRGGVLTLEPYEDVVGDTRPQAHTDPATLPDLPPTESPATGNGHGPTEPATTAAGAGETGAGTETDSA